MTGSVASAENRGARGLVLLCCILFLPPGCAASSESEGDDAAAAASLILEDLESWKFTADDVGRGRRLYRAACATCHGVSGNGKGPSAKAYRTKPRDFTEAKYKWRSTVTGLVPLDRDIYKTISRGVTGTAMPTWERLFSPRDRWRLVQYIKTFSDRFEEELAEMEPEEDIIEVPKAPKPTPEMVTRGKEIYAELQCSKCHGETGRGDGPSSAALTNEDGTKARIFDFTSGQYRCSRGGEPEDIYRAFYTGINGTPMPSWSDAIEEEDRWPLVYYVKSLEETGFFKDVLLGEKHPWGDLLFRVKH